MVEELWSIEETTTWDVIDLIVGHLGISLKWVVYKAKKDEHGRVIGYKA
jgi:hypothetical protein